MGINKNRSMVYDIFFFSFWGPSSRCGKNLRFRIYLKFEV